MRYLATPQNLGALAAGSPTAALKCGDNNGVRTVWTLWHLADGPWLLSQELEMIGAPGRAISKVAHVVSGMNCRAAAKANKGSNPIDIRLLRPYAVVRIARPHMDSVQQPNNRRLAAIAALQSEGSGWAGSGVDRGGQHDCAFIHPVACANVAQARRRY